MSDPAEPSGRPGMTVDTALTSRRSIRSYSSDPVSGASVNALLHAAVQAPTAMHAEPWLFVIVQDRATLKRYSDLAKAILLEEVDLYRNLHDPAVTKNSEFLRALGTPDFNVFYNAGTLILICARLTNQFVAADCWLAAENLMLAATAMGLGTCCIGSALPAVNSPEVKRELAIPFDVAVVAAIVVGVPSATPASSDRKGPVILSWKEAATNRGSGQPQ